MALTDILTVPFLVSLGVTLLLVGLVGYFFMQRLQEQNHKMASMLGLVTTMAEEMNFIRGRLQMISYQGGAAQQNSQPESGLEKQFSYEENLIPVSDGEDEDDDATSSDSDDEESEEESDSEEEEESDSEQEQIEFEELEPPAVKVINFGELLPTQDEPEEMDNNSEELAELDDEIDDDIDDIGSESGTESSADKNGAASQSSKPDFEFIKSIDISNLEELESSEKNSNVDYKKMSLNKLKDIAVAKGLIQENSKATKNAILKLLGSE